MSGAAARTGNFIKKEDTKINKKNKWKIVAATKLKQL